MRKLLAAGIVAAGALGASLQANATETIYEIDGSFGNNEHSCTQITFAFGGADCSYGRNRPGAAVDPDSTPGWFGPFSGGGHYNRDGIKDQLSHIPTAGSYAGGTSFNPAADDGKIEATIAGTLAIDDNGTAGDPTDDLISGAFTIGEMARNVATGQTSRAIQRWTTMDHVMAATAVNPTATVANGAGGVDYVIGSRGFPARLCNRGNATDCFNTANASLGNSVSGVVGDYDGDFPVSFWTPIAPGGIGIERTGLLADPAFTPTSPAPSPPTGNLGATTTATFTGYECEATNAADCNTSTILWGAGESPGFDNLIMKISTNALGAITDAQVFWTQEYFIGAFGPPPGYDNSWQAGTLSFTGQIVQPRANDFAQSVLQGSTGNVLDTVGNIANFPGQVTVTIVSGPNPALGVATVSSDEATINQIIYDSVGATGEDIIVYEATDGVATDQGTITITVAEDVQPVAPDGAITISTQGAAPGAATVGTLNVATLPTYSAGNAPATVSIVTQGTNGTATVTGTTVRYTPNATFFAGPDSIVYRVTDLNGDTDDGTIAITVTDVTPALNDGTITTEQDTASPAVVLGITPGNGSVAQHALAVSTQATSGTCAITGTAASPSVTYTPAAGFFGDDSCVVTITDGDGDPDTGTFTITVTEVNDAIRLPGGGSALDLWSLSLLGALPLVRRRRPG